MNSDSLVTVATQATAITALIVAVWQAVLGRKHNRQSVRPLLRADVNIVRESRYKGIAVKNLGLGPAIIESFMVRVQGLVMEGTVGGWGAARDALGIPPGRLSVGWMSAGDVLGQSESLDVFGLSGDAAVDDDEIRRFLRGLKNVELIVRYKSLYGEHFSCVFHGRKSGLDYDGYLPPTATQQGAQADSSHGVGPQ